MPVHHSPPSSALCQWGGYVAFTACPHLSPVHTCIPVIPIPDQFMSLHHPLVFLIHASQYHHLVIPIMLLNTINTILW
jgi:hypothetical protein